MQSAEFEKLLRQQSNAVFFTYLKTLIADETLQESNSTQRPFSLLEDIHILLESLAYIEITGKFSSVAVASSLSNQHDKLIPSRKHGTARYRMRDFLFQLTESDLANIIVFCRKLRKDKRRKQNRLVGMMQGLNDYCLKKSNKIDSPHELFIALTTVDKIKAQYYATYKMRNMSDTEIASLRAEITDEIQNGQLIIDESLLNEANSNDSDSPLITRIMRSSSSQRGGRQLSIDQQESSNDNHGDDAKNKRRNFNSNDSRNRINLHKNNGPMRIGKTIVIDLEGQDKREERYIANNQRTIVSPKKSFEQYANQQQVSIPQPSLASSMFNGVQRIGSQIDSNHNSPHNIINITSESEEYEDNNHQIFEQPRQKLSPMPCLEEDEDIESNHDQVNSGANNELDDGRNIFEMLNQICTVPESPQKNLTDSNRRSRENSVNNTNQRQLQLQLNQEVEKQEKDQHEEDDSRRSINDNDGNEDLLSHILKKQQEYLIKLFYANDLAEKHVQMPAQQKYILQGISRDSEALFAEIEASIENIIIQKKDSTGSNMSGLWIREYQHLQDENHRQYDYQPQMEQHKLENITSQQQPEAQHLEFEELNKQMLGIQLNTLNKEKEEQSGDQDQKQISQNNNNYQNNDLWDRLLSLLRQEYGLSSEELVALLDTLDWDVQLLLNYMQQSQYNLTN